MYNTPFFSETNKFSLSIKSIPHAYSKSCNFWIFRSLIPNAYSFEMKKRLDRIMIVEESKILN